MKSAERSSTAQTELTPAKKRLFSLVLLLLPLVFFVFLEIGLRIAGFGSYPALFVDIPGTTDYLQPSSDVATRYFRSTESMPSIPFDSFRKQRDEGSLRIFVQGGSTAAGYPFYFGGAMTDMLEHRLFQTFPGRSVEVVGTAMAAVNSYTLLDFVDEIIDQDPDAVVIYAGHNEYYGALGVGSAESLGNTPALIRAYLYLQKFRTVQAVRKMVAGIYAAARGSGADGSQARTLMERMVNDQRIPFGSDLYSAGLKQFESNMSRLLARYQAKGIPVFIGTVASNLRDHKPFISSKPTGDNLAAWNTLRDEANFHASGPNPREALKPLGNLIDLDSMSAEIYFARAKTHERLSDTASAKVDYLRAKEFDELRFRAPEEINAIIRRLAPKYGAIVVETEEALSSLSSIGIPGKEVMTEHLHPNSSGFFLLADAFYNALYESPAGSNGTYIPAEQAQSESLLTEVDSLVAIYRIKTLTSNWPFQPIGSPPIALDTLGTGPVGALALQLFKRDISRVDALDQLRGYYLSQGQPREALKVVFALIQRYPFWPNPYLSAASIMMNMGQLEEALLYSQVSNERGESAEALRLSGSLQLKLERPADAVPNLVRALELEPGDITAMYNLAGAYALTGEFPLAAAYADSVLTANPNHVAARRLRESLPVRPVAPRSGNN